MQEKNAPEVLVKVGVCDLLQRLDLVHWDEVAVQVHELNGNLHAGRRGSEDRGLLPVAESAVFVASKTTACVPGSLQPHIQQVMYTSLLPAS